MKTKITFIVIILMLFVTAMSFAQKKWEPYHQFSLDAGYTFSSLKENQNPSRLLFAGNGVNFGVGHRWGDTWGIASRIGFTTGSLDDDGIENVTARLKRPPVYIPYPPKDKSKIFSQISVMTGPSIRLGKKHQFEFNAMVGIGINPSPNYIRVDAYDQDIFLNTVYEAKDKSIVGMWEVNTSYKLALLSKKGKWIRILARYGSNGASIGLSVNIADQDCHGAMCERCPGVGCIPFTKPSVEK
jgi:hypothetical protein